MSADFDLPRDGEVAARSADGGGARTLRRPAVYAARKLRRAMSLPEVLLWQRLRRSPNGISFRKQHAIDPYVVDFYCSASRLVIEIDGEALSRGSRPQDDERRDAFLKARRYHLLRIPAQDVLKDPDSTAESILAHAANPLHHRAPLGGPPPRAGEDL